MSKMDTDYQFINTLIMMLPKNGRWSPKRRLAWLAAMTAAVDLVIRIDQTTTKPVVSGRGEG